MHARQITEADRAPANSPYFSFRANGKSVGLRQRAVSRERRRAAVNPFFNAGRVRTDSAFHSAEDVRLGSDRRRSLAAAGFKLRQGRPREVGRVAKTTSLERESDPTSKAEYRRHLLLHDLPNDDR